MRPGPKKPGESAAEYSARIKAMEQKFMGGGRPKTGGGGASSGGGRPKTGGGGASSGGGRPGPGKIDFGGKPKVPAFELTKPSKPLPPKMPGIRPAPPKMPGIIGMKRGGTAKGKK